MAHPLTDPWFNAEFIGEVEDKGSYRRIDSIEGAQGLFLYCPCRFGQDGGAHGLLVCFANPRGARPVPDNFPDPDREKKGLGKNPRWSMAGSGLADLTLTPSVAVGAGKECWHGFILQGQVT